MSAEAWRLAPRPASLAAVLLALVAPSATAAPQPIPEGPGVETLPAFVGAPATPMPVFATEPPRHRFMAPNGKSNIHVDAWQTDRNRWFGPLGRGTTRNSSFQSADCASHTFDRRGRLITVCVGLQGPRLVMFDPDTLDELARFQMPPRQLQAGATPIRSPTSRAVATSISTRTTARWFQPPPATSGWSPRRATAASLSSVTTT